MPPPPIYWLCCLASPSLSFLICKMDIIISIYLIALVRKLKRNINIMCLALWSMEHRKYTMTGVIIAVIIAIRLIILRGPT